MSPMIVSGLDPQVRMNAYLNGQQAQMQLKKQQDAMRIQQDAQQAEIRAQIQQAMLSHQKEQAKALKDANERAQMGDAVAIEQQNMEARAQGLPPEQKRLQDMSGSLAKIPEGPARDLARKEFMRYEGELRTEQQKQAAMQVIDTAAKDGIVDGALMQQRYEAGESAENLAQEAGKARQEQAKASVAMNESANSLAKAQMLIDSMPEDSPIRQRSELALAMFQGSKTAQETPGAGKKMLSQIQKLIQAEDFKQGVEDIRGGLSGAMLGTRAPEGATPGTHATVEGLKSGKIKGKGNQATVDQILAEATNEEDFMARLQKAKIPLTADLARQIAMLRQNAAPAGTQP